MSPLEERVLWALAVVIGIVVAIVAGRHFAVGETIPFGGTGTVRDVAVTLTGARCPTATESDDDPAHTPCRVRATLDNRSGDSVRVRDLVPQIFAGEDAYDPEPGGDTEELIPPGGDITVVWIFNLAVSVREAQMRFRHDERKKFEVEFERPAAPTPHDTGRLRSTCTTPAPRREPGRGGIRRAPATRRCAAEG
jgi:hypothetical protein